MTFSKRRAQRGMTLMEVLVAMLIFTIVFLVALGLYEVANRAYLRTDAATIQQQNVRFAMDRLSETIRDAGANYNTLGANNVADEQIEGAWDAAVFVRGDFDNSRETPLESTTFPIVTTGNDEIVGYVLRKPGGDANNNVSLSVKMDVTPATGRDAILNGTTITGEETVTVKAAAAALTDETDPPYQLTRVTFDAAGAPKYEVVAEDVFRLSFTYLDSTGAAAITTFGGADAQRAERATVRQVDVNLIGMSSRHDPGYTDAAVYTPAEGTSTKDRRKLSLTEHIVPPNLGLVGKRHSSLPSIAIAPPASIMVCTGHCQYFGISWPASTTAGVTQYEVVVNAAAGVNPLTDPAIVDETHTVSGLAFDYHQLYPGARAYSFKVAAIAGPDKSAYTSSVSATATNDAASVPSAPSGVIAAQNSTGENATLVNWTAVTTNTGPITAATCTSSAGGSSVPASPWNITPIDLSYYKVYRVRSDGVTTGSFTAGPLNRVDNQVAGTLVNVTPSGAYSAGGDSRGAFVDHTAAPCSAYFYRVQAFDYCDVGSTSSPAMGTAFSYDVQPTTIVPDVPGGTAGASTAVTGSTTSSGGNYNVVISWPAVTQTSTGVPAATAHYKVDRYRKVDPAATYSLDAQLDAYEATTYSDAVPTTVSGSPATYQYYVRALYDCASPRSSTQAGPYTATCTPSGSMIIGSPASGGDYARPDVTAVTPTLVTTGSGWTSATVTITGPSPSAATVYTRTISGAPTANAYTFPTFDVSNTGTYPNGVYTISATASAGSCTTQAQVRQFTLSTVVCGLQLATSPAPAFQGSGANTAGGFTFQITNTCTVSSITFNSLKFTWTGVDAAQFITSIVYGASTVASGRTLLTGGNGVLISFSAAQSIGPGATSPTISLNFDGKNKGNFTSDGSKDGTPGKFTSIIAHETNFTPSDDELIPGSPVP
jgi:prepilin-type N-terminal cleavage/methylation domain-containing protein